MGSKTTKKEMPEFQQRFIEDVMIPFSRGIADTEFEAYTGDRVAGLSDLEQQAMTGYGALTLPSEITQATDIVRSVAARTPQERVTRLAEIQDELAPLLNRQFAQQGIGREAQAIKANAFGDRRAVYEAERQAALQAQALQQAQAQFQAEENQRLRGAGVLSEMAIRGLGTQTDILGKQMAAGAAQRGLTQADLDAQYQEFLRGYADPLRKFGVLTGAAGAIPTGYGTTTERDPMGQAGALLTAGGSFLTGAAPIMGFSPFAGLGR